MIKLTAILPLLLALCFQLKAQQAQINGFIEDGDNQSFLEYSSVSLLRNTDSVLVKHSRTAKDGKFEMKGLTPGKYILMVTHPTYAHYVDQIKLDSGQVLQLGVIKLLLKAKLLENVTVRQTIAAIKMKGDTLEYTSDSFKVRQGASVEDLLKKLPGIQVDKDGKITAQGEKVEKVLVDGEEFFGDDPTIATKGLQADALEKVQVFDKKSDQATFTGIDDGERTKTLNLKLKEDKKKGFFGKLDVAGGNDDRWNNSVMLNVFKGKRKLSGYGIMSSTGKTGLDWNERSNYGGGMNMEYMDEGYYFSGGGDDFDGGSFSGSGLPKSWTGGVHYSNKFDEDRQNINSSYRYSQVNTEGMTGTFSQSIIPGNLYFTKSSGNSNSTKFKHALNGLYEFNIDSFSSIKITLNTNTGETKSSAVNSSESFNEQGQLYNSSNRLSTSTGSNKSFNSTFLYRKRFRKAGRTISLNVDQQYNNTGNTGWLYSTNNFYKTGLIDSTQFIDQQKLNKNKTNSVASKLVYTEPISKKFFAEINYALRLSNTESQKFSYNADNSGKYNQFDSLFSNSYKYDYIIQSGGLNFKYNGKKITAGAGSDLVQSDFTQQDFIRKETLSRQFVNIFPKASFNYKINSNSRFSISYNGNTRQPSITQIQPIRDNANPLNIAVGNPDLKQEFRHQFRINYNSYKVLNQRGFYFNSSFSTTSNAIGMSEVIDSNRVRTYQYVNVNGGYNYNGWMNYGLKLKKLDAYINFGLGFNGSRSVTYINKQQNITNSTSPNINFSFNKGKEKKYSFNLGGSFSYSTANSSVNKTAESNFWMFSAEPSLIVTLPFKFEINVETEISLREKTTVFDNNNNVYLLNGYLGRKLLKNDKAIIKLTGYDILNQNRGVNRYISNNTITQSNNQVLTRYFTISFAWNFSKTPAGMGPSED